MARDHMADLAAAIANAKAQTAARGYALPNMIKLPRGSAPGSPIANMLAPRAGGANAAFVKSFEGVSGSSMVAYRDPGGLTRTSGMNVRINMNVRLSEDSRRFLARLPRADPVVRKATSRALRRAVQKAVLPTLRREIPMSSKKSWAVAERGSLKGSRKRGRTTGYKKTKHLRKTVRAEPYKQQPGRKGVVRVTVGNADLWYGAALHARVPYLANTVRQTQNDLHRELGKAMVDIMRWMDTGRRGLL